MEPAGPYSLLASLDGLTDKSRPPIHLWNPENVKDIDMEIRANGEWYYLGTPILRHRLVHLFSSVLRREGDDYFLVTPVEKCRIRVVDKPFVIVNLEETGESEAQVLQLTTNVGETVTVDAEHPITVDTIDGEPLPGVYVRDGLEARFNRNTYYHLADLGTAIKREDGEWFGIWSSGVFYPWSKV